MKNARIGAEMQWGGKLEGGASAPRHLGNALLAVESDNRSSGAEIQQSRPEVEKAIQQAATVAERNDFQLAGHDVAFIRY